jgi:type IV pilus assembly protein PilW
MKDRGFTIIELIIAMFIVSVLLVLTAMSFDRILFGVRSETSSAEGGIERLVGLQLLRLDLEHLGFGIARDTADPPVAWTEGAGPANRLLTLRSTLNNSNPGTIGWFLYDCTAGGSYTARQVASGGTGLNNTIVVLDQNRAFVENNNRATGNCPAGIQVLTGYPYDGTVANGCSTSAQWCNQTTYRLSVGQDLSTCAPGTRNLLRAVGASAGNPVLNCVADFKVRFDLDSDENGTVETNNTTLLPATTADIIDQVRNVDIYILVQVGLRRIEASGSDRALFSGTTTLDGVTFDTAGIPDFNNYQWKTLKFSGKPMSWQ